MHKLFNLLSVALLCEIGHSLKDANGTTILQPILPGTLGLGRRDSPSVGLQNQTSLLWGDGVDKGICSQSLRVSRIFD